MAGRGKARLGKGMVVVMLGKARTEWKYKRREGKVRTE